LNSSCLIGPEITVDSFEFKTPALTVTLNVPLLTLLAASVAVTVTVVVPSGNNVPLALEYAITGLALTLSVALAAE